LITGAVGSWKAFFCLAPKSGEMNEMTPNKRLTNPLARRLPGTQGMQYSYLGSFVSAVNNLRFCTRRVLEGTVHRSKIPLWSPSLLGIEDGNTVIEPVFGVAQRLRAL